MLKTTFICNEQAASVGTIAPRSYNEINLDNDSLRAYAQITATTDSQEDIDAVFNLLNGKTVDLTDTYDPHILGNLLGRINDLKTQIQQVSVCDPLEQIAANAGETLDICTEVPNVVFNWQLNDPQSISYRLGMLVSHELLNLATPLLSSGCMLECMPELLDTVSSSIDPMLSLTRTIVSVMESGDRKISAEELLSSLLVESNKEVVISPGVEFASFEEFLTVRTLVHNSLKTKYADKAFIHVSMAETETGRSFSVSDNAIDDWSDKNMNNQQRYYNLGQMYPSFPMVISSGGGNMVAFRAGQRGVAIPLLTPQGLDGFKSITVCF